VKRNRPAPIDYAAKYVKPGESATIPAQYGYWDTTDSACYGGAFRTAPADGLPVTVTATFPNFNGCNVKGRTADGLTVIFNVDCLPAFKAATAAMFATT
jgi:hypothetical protein